PAGRQHHADLLRLRIRQYRHGQRHPARGRGTAAAGQLRRHLAGDATARFWYFDEHPHPQETGNFLMNMTRLALPLALCLIVCACGGNVRPDSSPAGSSGSRSGGYYLDDGPGDNPPADIDGLPDATPRPEPLLARANKPYLALGKRYTPLTEFRPYKERGIASWYGKRYHGRKTSSGEVYDMYGMTGA